MGRCVARGPCAGAELAEGLGRVAGGRVQPLPSKLVPPRAAVAESGSCVPEAPSPPGAVEGPLHLGPRRRRPGLAGFSLNLLCVLGA